MAYLLLLEFNH